MKNLDTFFKTGVALALLSVFSACPKNKSNQAQQQQNVYVNCTTCNGVNGGEFMSTESVDYNSILNLKMSLSGVVNPNTSYLYNPSNYQGLVAANSGQLSLSQPISVPTCYIPVGSY